METIVIDRKGARLSLDDRRLRVDLPDGERPRLVPLAAIERVVVTARAEIATNLVAALGAQGASLVILSPRDHRRTALFLPPSGGDAAARLAQAKALLSPAFRLACARRIVRAKLARQARNLPRFGRGPAVRAASRMLARARRSVRGASDAEALRAIEGGATRLYFAAFAEALPSRLGFSGRNRRPPRDPANAVLSLGYTLLHADAVRAIHQAALDPLLGFHHTPEHGRESLACDLVEPLRPAVDAFVLRLFRAGELRPEDFGRQQDAVLLGKAGRARFYAAWDEAARPWRKALLGLARRFRRLVREEAGAC